MDLTSTLTHLAQGQGHYVILKNAFCTEGIDYKILTAHDDFPQIVQNVHFFGDIMNFQTVASKFCLLPIYS